MVDSERGCGIVVVEEEAEERGGGLNWGELEDAGISGEKSSREVGFGILVVLVLSRRQRTVFVMLQ